MLSLLRYLLLIASLFFGCRLWTFGGLFVCRLFYKVIAVQLRHPSTAVIWQLNRILMRY